MMAKPLAEKRQPGAMRFGGSISVEDAEFETILPAPAPSATRDIKALPKPALPAGLHVLSKRLSEHGDHPAKSLPGVSYWLLVGLLAMTAFWMSGGYELVRNSDQQALSATPIAKQMRLTDVNTRIEKHGAGDVIFIAATIQNHGTENGLPPELMVTLENQNGEKHHHRLSAQHMSVLARGNLAFASRIPAPHGSVANIKVALRPL